MSRPGSIILNLPAAVLVQVLATFVATTDDIGRLDSACCSHADRNKLLELFIHNNLGLTMNSRLIADVSGCMRWSVSRKVRFGVIKFTGRTKVAETLLAQFFQTTHQYITEVHDHPKSENQVVKAMQSVDGTFVQLKILHILGNDSTASYTAQFLQKAPSLEHLVLHCRDAAESDFIGACCPMVTTVKLNGLFMQHGMDGLDTCFPNMESLELKAHVSPTYNISKLIASYFKLRKLTFNNAKTIRNERIREVAQLCPYLTHFGVDYCNNVTIDSVAAICTYCTQLESLSLQGNGEFPPATLTLIANHLSNTLKHLNICYCREIGTVDLSVLRTCTLLESLDISSVWDMNHTFLLALFRSCTRLHTVYMNFSYVSDTLLWGIAEHCPHVENFAMEGAWGFTKEGVWAIAGGLKTLTVEARAAESSILELASLREKYTSLRIET